MLTTRDVPRPPGPSSDVPSSLKVGGGAPFPAPKPQIITWGSHRFLAYSRWPTFCVDCHELFADETSLDSLCDTTRPLCESCRIHPASIIEFGYRVCASCKNGGGR